MRFNLYLFGGPRLERDGVPVKFSRRKSLALLLYLAVTKQTYSRESLATLFWPDADSKRSRATLRQSLLDLNQVLPPDYIVLEGDTVHLRAAEELWVDAMAFQRLLHSCQTHGHPVEEPCMACVPLLSDAVALYQGDFLQGFSLTDSAEFDDWQALEASALRNDLTRALARLVRHHLRPNTEAALPFARQWAALDPLNELPHMALMRIYAETGQQAAALRQYQDYAKRLEDELGIQPSKEMQDLYRWAQTPTDSLARQSVTDLASASPLKTSPQAHLPLPSTPFIGRELERTEIHRLLTDPTTRLVTLIGPGGIGKTRLGLQAATEAQDHFADGVYFIPLESVASLDGMLSVISEAMMFTPTRPDDPRGQMWSHLASKNALLVMDNFESFPEGATLVNELLQTAAHIKVLATSREKLNLQGEHTLFLEGLALPEPAPDDVMPEWSQYSALVLFVQSAQQARPDFQVTPEEMPYLIDIGRMVEGAPLGLVLAAGWADTLSLSEIAAELNQSLDFLETTARNVPARHRSLRAVFDSSWKLLEESERLTFMRMGVFRGSFTRHAAQTIVGASLQTLRLLVSKSLLRFDASAQRYQLHVLLRQYAEEKLTTSGQADATYQAYCGYFGEVLRKHAAAIKNGRNVLTILTDIAADFENLRAAWLWAASHRLYDYVNQFIEGMSVYFTHRNLWDEAEELFGVVRQYLAPRENEEPHPVWGRLLTYFYGTSPARKAWVLQGLEIAQRYHDTAAIARCHAELGWFALKIADYMTAVLAFDSALPYFREAQENYHVIHLLRAQAIAYSALGEWYQALRTGQEALALSRTLEDKLRLAECLGTRGVLYCFMGDYAAALQDLREAYTLQHETGRWADLTVSNLMLSWLHFLNGDFELSRQIAEEVLSVAHGSSMRELRGLGLIQLGLAASMTAQDDQARKYFEASRLILSAPDLQQAWATAVNRSLLFITDWGPAVMACALDDEPRAYAALKATLATQFTRASLAAQTLCLPVAVLLIEKQQPEQAVELLALALHHPQSASAWMRKWQRLMQCQSDLRQRLGEAVFESHWQSGKTRRLEEINLDEWLGVQQVA